MTNTPLDLPSHTGSRTTRLLGATVLVGVVTMVLLGFFVAPEDDLREVAEGQKEPVRDGDRVL